MSRTFSTKKGSLDSLKVSERCGCKHRRPARCDEWSSRARGRSPAPSTKAPMGRDESGGVSSSVSRDRFRDGVIADLTRRAGAGFVRTDRRGPPLHSSDATCPLGVRARLETERQISLFSNPSAAAKTIRARRASPCDVLRRRDSASNSARSSSLKETASPPLSPSSRASNQNAELET